MGAAFAPSYAGLFLGLWERDLFLSDRLGSIEHVLLWARYIDDIFFVWQGTPIDLAQFIDTLNSNDRNIHLTLCSYDKTLDFLDVTIRRDPCGMLQSDVYRKETATNTLLHATSGHPGHMISGSKCTQHMSDLPLPLTYRSSQTFFMTTTGKVVVNPSTALRQYHDRYKLPNITSQIVRRVGEIWTLTRYSDSKKRLFARYLAHTNDMAEIVYQEKTLTDMSHAHELVVNSGKADEADCQPPMI
ncbi:unnamed protein product [Ranitomeya imitator]|uniref:Reverse transcriptase domain-containing protein n=1 Tax=Ranitomeya imitator TaxID=111125 RepID=A0ABN9KMQ4_9NEOB|nr:unnamed protein product [Ranitomeya imitator]